MQEKRIARLTLTVTADGTILAIEIGFHCEHRGIEPNDQAIAALMTSERSWRKVLGEEADPKAEPLSAFLDTLRATPPPKTITSGSIK